MNIRGLILLTYILDYGIFLKSVQATFKVIFVKFIFLAPLELVMLNTASSVSPKYTPFIVYTFLDITLMKSVGLIFAILASTLIKISTLSAGAKVTLVKLSTEFRLR